MCIATAVELLRAIVPTLEYVSWCRRAPCLLCEYLLVPSGMLLSVLTGMQFGAPIETCMCVCVQMLAAAAHHQYRQALMTAWGLSATMHSFTVPC